MHAKSLQSCLILCDPMAPLCMGFSRQESWNGLLCPSPGDLPYPGIEPMSFMSPAVADRFFTTSATWEVGSTASFRCQPKSDQRKHLIHLQFPLGTVGQMKAPAHTARIPNLVGPTLDPVLFAV